jgi:glyceraldehyde-3-phosphate dehydrogenase (NAD(P))
MKQEKIRVAINGYGVIGRRVADAVALQSDMELVGVADISTTWRTKIAGQRQFPVFSATPEAMAPMREAGFKIEGTLTDMLKVAQVVVDCAPKSVGAANVQKYKDANVKFIIQGGEKHSVTGHSFVAESNYEQTLGLSSTRVVSCNTTSIVRTLTALKRKGLLKKARGTLLRRATDPWESHLNGIMNTLVPEENIPSHQGPDAQSVDPGLDVITMAVKVPETLGHVHFWNVQLTRTASKEEVLSAFQTSSRIAYVRMSDGLVAINSVKDLMMEIGRDRENLYEVALWEDLIEVKGDEAFYSYMVDNQAIVIPETIDAIRALDGQIKSPGQSIEMTNSALGIRSRFI